MASTPTSWTESKNLLKIVIIVLFNLVKDPNLTKIKINLVEIK
jgi:hypothetical protein